MYVMSYIDFVLKSADYVWYIIRYKLACARRRNNSRKLRKVYASCLWFSGAHHVETRSPCFPIFRCVPTKERTWLEKKLRQDMKMFVMQCLYVSLNTSLNELTRRNKTLVEEYHVKVASFSFIPTFA